MLAAAGSPPPALAALPIVSERLVAAVSKTHFLSERVRLTLAGLAGCQLICLPAGMGIRTVFDQAAAAAGVRLEVALEASAPAAVADLAARGLGVAILSETIAAAAADRLRRPVSARPERAPRSGTARPGRRSPPPLQRATISG
jgi:DNA-binding transcriptional LysR family regulator